MGGSQDAYPVYFDPKGDAAAPAEERKLIGSPHAERKRSGKEKCRYASGRGEDLTEPLLSHAPASTAAPAFTCPCLYRQWRDPEGTQREWRAPHRKASLGGGTARRWKGAGTRIQKCRLKRDRLKRKRGGEKRKRKERADGPGRKGSPHGTTGSGTTGSGKTGRLPWDSPNASRTRSTWFCDAAQT